MSGTLTGGTIRSCAMANSPRSGFAAIVRRTSLSTMPTTFEPPSSTGKTSCHADAAAFWMTSLAGVRVSNVTYGRSRTTTSMTRTPLSTSKMRSSRCAGESRFVAHLRVVEAAVAEGDERDHLRQHERHE